MTFLSSPVPSPIVLPDGTVSVRAVYTGTACLALMDSAVTGEVWEDLLYDGVDHDHGSGGLMLNSSSVGTHLEHDGDFPVLLVLDPDGNTLGFRVNLDPYAADLSDVRELDAHGDDHGHAHSHGDGHEHDHPHSHDHGSDHVDLDDELHGHPHSSGHAEGWSSPEKVRLVSAAAVFGDPAGLPEADDTGDLISLTFPAPGGELSLTVYTEHGLRREIVGVWNP